MNCFECGVELQEFGPQWVSEITTAEGPVPGFEGVHIFVVLCKSCMFPNEGS